ncbi:MAG: dTDP-4-dehydrorhamnose reductase [Solirubrobacteraceae bacterium]
MRVLVTGAGGMLGRDVVEVARRAGHDTVGLTRAELDVSEPDAVRNAVAGAAPEVIVNCAAWTDVDGAEDAEQAALAVNRGGAAHLARSGPALIHVSTDYVFDGQAKRPYVESDPTAPSSAYGRTKLAGEVEVLRAGHGVVRTAWLFGAGGRNFAATMLQLASRRDSVQVVSDQIGCPTYTGHLAPALVTLAERRSTGLHHLAGSGQCSWMEFAREIFAQAGIACEVLPASSEQMARPAPRPPWSVLASERDDALVLPSWQHGLAEYLRETAPVRA